MYSQSSSSVILKKCYSMGNLNLSITKLLLMGVLVDAATTSYVSSLLSASFPDFVYDLIMYVVRQKAQLSKGYGQISTSSTLSDGTLSPNHFLS